MTKIKTIKLQGKDYAQVKDRLKIFREKFPAGTITTSVDFKEGFAIFTATISIKGEVVSSAHSLGKTSGAKAFEKLETIAVGRALAFAGFSADGEIASFEEMNEFKKQKPVLDENHKGWQKAKLAVANGETTVEAIRKNYDISDADFAKLSKEL